MNYETALDALEEDIEMGRSEAIEMVEECIETRRSLLRVFVESLTVWTDFYSYRCAGKR